MSLAEEIGRSPNSHPAVAGRRLCLTFYDMVQGRENPAMIRRCLKTGIGGKSADHRTILKACDAAIKFAGSPSDESRMGAKSADGRRIFAGFEPWITAR